MRYLVICQHAALVGRVLYEGESPTDALRAHWSAGPLGSAEILADGEAVVDPPYELGAGLDDVGDVLPDMTVEALRATLIPGLEARVRAAVMFGYDRDDYLPRRDGDSHPLHGLYVGDGCYRRAVARPAGDVR